MYVQTDRHTDKQTDRQTYTQTDRQTDGEELKSLMQAGPFRVQHKQTLDRYNGF